MGKIAKVQEVPLTKLRPYERNAKIHGQSQVEKIKASIQEFGFLSPCLIDSDYNIIAGHGRVAAAKELGLAKVPCVFIEGLTEEQRRAYILADNKLTELGEWDMDLVAGELKALDETGFDISITGFEIDCAFLDQEPVDDLKTWDDVEESMKEEELTRPGDIWKLGDHRLMVGDSTKLEDVMRLMDGEEADLLETDPPYNVAVSNASGDTIENDNLSEQAFERFLLSAFSNAYAALRDGGAFYVWHADSNGRVFRDTLEDADLKIRQNLIWVKNHFTLGRQDYQWIHEPCLYGWKGGAAHYFQSARNIPSVIKSKDLNDATKEELIQLLNEIKESSTVLYADRPSKDDLHPTMKPVDLVTKQVKNSSQEGDIVLDLFGGSGTTLIVCEQLNRRCFMMEFDPKYADVIIRRWEKETGSSAVLEERGE